MQINKKSPIPVYYQLRNLILKKIQDGEYGAGALIPSERELSDSLNISRMTVRQALSQLVVEGVLFREKGKGTFVSNTKIQQKNIMSFSDTVRSKGLTPSTKVIFMSRETELADVNEMLGLANGEAVYAVKRLRMADNIPVAIEEAYIPEKYCPALEKYDLTLSLYQIIKNEYSYKIEFIDNTIEAVKPVKDERDLLDIPASTPVLKISGISSTDDGKKLMFERNVYRSDMYSYDVRIYMNRSNA